ncbi:MAG: tetraacyldisaccharide 4'-kinase [Phycisphaerales bacterium]|nr:tetraacyldisaccharide 4'-kinase [Planctomycetota bacterium]MBL6998123.1 tetraacyldisaccharide 4'-kinase [Phycisphaerales bacterium]
MRTPLPSWLDFFAIPASWLYGKIVGIRNCYYDRGKNVHTVGRPVIAVGNLTVGGTGKTPLVTWIVRRLRKHGHNPAIVMRGYAAVELECADEAVEYRQRLHDIEVIVGADRVETVNEYIANGGEADCFVMDDGFQHRRIARDLDIVVMDYLRDPFKQRMLPAGWLREPVIGLKRADAVVVSHAQRINPDFAQVVENVSGYPPVAWTTHHWSGLELHDETGTYIKTLDWLTGRSVAVRLGIGYPGSVIEALVRLGAKISSQMDAGDHQPFSNEEIAELTTISPKVDAIVMTLKDWVKAKDVIDLKSLQCPIIVPTLELEVVDGAQALEAKLLSVFKIR